MSKRFTWSIHDLLLYEKSGKGITEHFYEALGYLDHFRKRKRNKTKREFLRGLGQTILNSVVEFKKINSVTIN